MSPRLIREGLCRDHVTVTRASITGDLLSLWIPKALLVLDEQHHHDHDHLLQDHHGHHDQPDEIHIREAPKKRNCLFKTKQMISGTNYNWGKSPTDFFWRGSLQYDDDDDQRAKTKPGVDLMKSQRVKKPMFPSLDNLLHPFPWELPQSFSPRITSNWHSAAPFEPPSQKPSSGWEDAYLPDICVLPVFIPHICPFWYTTILFRPVKSTPTKCVNLEQFFFAIKQRKWKFGIQIHIVVFFLHIWCFFCIVGVFLA